MTPDRSNARVHRALPVLLLALGATLACASGPAGSDAGPGAAIHHASDWAVFDDDGDGRVDRYVEYRKGSASPIQARIDADGDGLVDTWVAYSNDGHREARVRRDLDGDGFADDGAPPAAVASGPGAR